MNQILIEKKENLNANSKNLNHSGFGMLVVIDRNVDDISTLVNGVLADAKVLVLNLATDSIEQITRALAEETFNSLHIVSHGAPGVLYLGNNPLTLDNLDHYSYQLQEWGVPEILLYGCNVAAGDAGSEFIDQLHQLTGADIAASRTKTGGAAVGGNWDLEVQTNQQEVNLAFDNSTIADYPFTLVERVSAASDGTESNSSSYQPSISADGRYVAFYSDANNLISGDTNGTSDIFVHDRQTGTTERVSAASDGTEGNSYSSEPSISADGRYVAFYSDANNLVSGDTNGTSDIFVHDRQTETTERVSAASDGTESNSSSYQPSISADGRYVAFYSDANNLVSRDTNSTSDIFVVANSLAPSNSAPVADDVTGTPEDDFLEGMPKGENITGLAGSDFLIGDSGNDQIEGGEDFDFIEAGDGNDTVDGGGDDDLMTGDVGDDLMLASPGFDFFDGGVGEDTADYSNIGAAIVFDAQTLVDKGTAGIDEIFDVETIIGALDAANKIDGSTGVNDTNSLSINLAANILTVDDGTNSITYNIENFLNVSGNSEADSLIGNDGDNILNGGAGLDSLNGKAGADTLIGVDATSTTPGAGERDRLIGGADADVFVLGDADGVFYLDEGGFFGRSGIAMILDFESGVDKIQLSGVADDYITRGSYIFADEGSRDGVLDRGDDMIAYARGGFDADDFVFVS